MRLVDRVHIDAKNMFGVNSLVNKSIQISNGFFILDRCSLLPEELPTFYCLLYDKYKWNYLNPSSVTVYHYVIGDVVIGGVYDIHRKLPLTAVRL